MSHWPRYPNLPFRSPVKNPARTLGPYQFLEQQRWETVPDRREPFTLEI